MGVEVLLEVGDVGERAGEALGPHRVHREHDLAVVGIAEVHVGERVGDAPGEQEQQVARVVVVDVGEWERALATVHGHDVVGRREAAPLGERRPRRSLLPLAEAHPEASGLAEDGARGLARPLATDVAEAERDGAADGHRTPPAGSAHAPRAEVDPELSAAKDRSR